MAAPLPPPNGRTGLMQRAFPPPNHPLYPALAMRGGTTADTMIATRTFQEAVEDIFWYMDATSGGQDENLSSTGNKQRRLIDIINPSSFRPYAPVNRIQIVTSTQAPPTDEIGEEGVPMHVVLPASHGETTEKYYYAKVMPVESDLFTLASEPSQRKSKAALKSFREVMINLSLFPDVAASLAQGTLPPVAPMYNWFFTSIGPKDRRFIGQFSDSWTPFVFKTFYGSYMRTELNSMFTTDLQRLSTIRGKTEELSSQELGSMYEKYKQSEHRATSQKDQADHIAERIQIFKDAIEGHYSNVAKNDDRGMLGYYYKKFLGKEWREAAPVRALVLIAESVGEISLKKAYSKHGYSFPFPRFLGRWDMPTAYDTVTVRLANGKTKQKKTNFRDRQIVEKRYGIVFSRRPFAALMMHVLAIAEKFSQMQVVHGDFHSGNMIAIPVQGQTQNAHREVGEGRIPLDTPGWRWSPGYNDMAPMSRNNRQAGNIAWGTNMQYNDLPLYVNMAPFGQGYQLPFPYTVGWPASATDRQNPGQYLQFTMIDLGFAYMHPDHIANKLRVLTADNPAFASLTPAVRGAHVRNKTMIDSMWNGQLLRSRGIYPVMYHPWYDTFRLGMYMAQHVINAVDYPRRRNREGQWTDPDVPLPLPGRSRGNVMLEIIVRMMTTPSWLDGSAQTSPFYRSKGQGDIYTGVTPYETLQNYYNDLVNSFYTNSQEFMSSSRFSIEFVTFALHLTELPDAWRTYAASGGDRNFLKCHSAISLMRHFLLVIVDIYNTFEMSVLPSGSYGFRYRGDDNDARDPRNVHHVQRLFENEIYMQNVKKARTIVNNMFTDSLSTLLHSGAVLADYKSPASIINDRNLWSVLI